MEFLPFIVWVLFALAYTFIALFLSRKFKKLYTIEESPDFKSRIGPIVYVLIWIFIGGASLFATLALVEGWKLFS